MRLSKVFDDFMRYMRVEAGAAHNTLIIYQRCFKSFMIYAEGRVGLSVPLSEFTTELCRDYQYELTQRRNLKPSSIRLHLCTLSSLGRWATRARLIAANPVDPLAKPKRKVRLPVVPRFDVVTNWLENGLDIRSKALIALMAYGGLRCSEVVSLNLGDYDPKFGLRRVLGKGGDENGVALPLVAKGILDHYIASVRATAGPRDPMFITRYLTIGRREIVRRMHEDRVYTLIKAIGRREGMPEIHPHSFRHACAVEMLSRTKGNLRAVQLHLRHANPATTAIYARIAQPELQGIVSEAFDGR